MKIGIISDTHIIHRIDSINDSWIETAFKDTQMIIHAGDLERPELVGAFNQPVYAVRGNCDPFTDTLPLTRSIETEAGLITVAHRVEDARAALSERSVVMIYGHTHIPVISQQENLLVINPGSARLPRGGFPASVAVLEISSKVLKAELKTVDEMRREYNTDK